MKLLILGACCALPYAHGVDIAKKIQDIEKQISAGAQQINKATLPGGELSQIPPKIGQMYDQISSKLPDIESAIKKNSEGKAGIAKVRTTIESNKKITPDLKSNLLAALSSLDSGLTKLSSILTELQKDIMATSKEKNGKLADITRLISKAQVNAQEPKNLNLIIRMNSLASALENVRKTASFGQEEISKIEAGAAIAKKEFDQAGEAFKSGDIGGGLKKSAEAIGAFFSSW